MIDTDSPFIKQRARFRLSIPLSLDGERQSAGRSVVDALFTKARGMRGRITVGQRRHGGAALPFKWPTGVTFDNLTLQAGATESLDLRRWFVESAEAAAGITDLSDFKTTMALREFNRERECINEWVFAGAFCVEWSPGEYDGASDRFLIEQVVIAHDGIIGGQRRRRRGAPRVEIPDITSIMKRIL